VRNGLCCEHLQQSLQDLSRGEIREGRRVGRGRSLQDSSRVEIQEGRSVGRGRFCRHLQQVSMA
jgi:hypothetical protein